MNISGLANKAPRSQVFTRAFMEATKKNTSLRGCGGVGREAVEEQGLQIDDREISRLTRDLGKMGVIEKVRKGRSFVVEQGPNYEDYFEWLENEAPEGWGEEARDTREEERMEAYRRVVEEGESLISKEGNRIPYGAFGYLMRAVQDGELELAFYPAGARLGIIEKNPETGKNRVKGLKTWN